MRFSCLKNLLYASNVLLWIFGLILLGCGFFAEFDRRFVDRIVLGGADPGLDHPGVTANPTPPSADDAVFVVSSYVRFAARSLLALGGVFFLAGFLGCIGAWRGAKSCLAAFFTALLLALLLTLALLGAAFFAAASSDSPDPVAARIGEGFERLVEEAWSALDDADRIAFERDHACCGLRDPAGIGEALGRTDCGASIDADGCFRQLEAAFRVGFWALGAVMLGLGAFEIFAMTVGCVLFQRMRKPYVAV